MASRAASTRLAEIGWGHLTSRAVDCLSCAEPIALPDLRDQNVPINPGHVPASDWPDRLRLPLRARMQGHLAGERSTGRGLQRP